MIKARAENIFINIERIRRINLIREERDSNLLSVETTLTHIAKIDLLIMNSRRKTPWEKGGIPPIKCWGCKEDHMYKYFPHKEDKMLTLHNIQESTTIEGMGKNIPRIYASLEDR
jgi:hypothetical protein